jgi:hypothetical protein
LDQDCEPLSNPFYEKILQAIELEENERWKKLRELDIEVDRGIAEEKPLDVQLNEDESNHLIAAALDLLKQGHVGEFLAIIGILSGVGIIPISYIVETLLEDNPKMLMVVKQQFQRLINVLIHGEMFSPDEKPLFYEHAKISFNNRDVLRLGILILTNNRLICLGEVVGPVTHRSTIYRPYYSEDEEYIDSIDYIQLSSIRNIESLWSFSKKQIEITFDTKYSKEKGITLYLPMFAVDIPKRHSVEEGGLKAIIQLAEVPSRVKDFRKKRQEELIRRINVLQESGLSIE